MDIGGFRHGPQDFRIVRLGLLGAALYTLSCYRLVCTYIRASVGEYTAITFLPLVLVGLYNIYTHREAHLPSGRHGLWHGGAGAVPSAQRELIALLLVVFCLLRLRDTLRPARLLAWAKAALLAVALSAWYFFPFLISTHEINLMVNGPLIGKIQNQGTYLVQLSAVWAGIRWGGFGHKPGYDAVGSACHWWWGCCWCFTACCGGKAGTTGIPCTACRQHLALRCWQRYCPCMCSRGTASTTGWAARWAS